MKKIFLFGIIILVYATACKKKATPEEGGHEVLPENVVEMNDDQMKMAGIAEGQIEMRMLGNVIKASGQVSVPPQEIVSVCAPLGGYIQRMNLQQGSPVKKGQVIATLENPLFIEIQQDYLESKNKLEYAEADFKRQQELHNGNAGSTKTFQQAQSEYRSLQARVQGLREKLAMAGIVADGLSEKNLSRAASVISPINGFIKTVNVNTGKYVNPTDVMFEIVGNDARTLELTIYEKDAMTVHAGQSVRFFLPNQPDQSFQADITQLSKAVNDDKTMRVYASIRSSSAGILPGMYVTALIETGDAMVTSLPDEAIVSFDDKFYIFTPKGQRDEDGKKVNDFLMIEVRKGATANGFSEVILPSAFDIKAKKIVVKGAFQLLAKKKNGGEMSC